MSKREKIALISSVIFWILCTNVWAGNGSGIYYVGIAQVILVASWIIHNKARVKIDLFITRSFLFLAFNNFIDEIFFDPTKFQLYEYISVMTYLIYNYLSIYKPRWVVIFISKLKKIIRRCFNFLINTIRTLISLIYFLIKKTVRIINLIKWMK